MDLETAGRRAQVVAALQAAASSLAQLRALTYFVVKSTGQAAALRSEPPPADTEVALLLAAVPAAREILAASRAGRTAIKRADRLKRPPGKPIGPSRPIAAAVEHLRGRSKRLRTAALVKSFPAVGPVVEHACRSLEEVDKILAGLECMAAAARTADPQLLADLELLAAPEEDGEPS